MKNVSRLLPLLPGMALLTGCNQKVQKDNRQNSPKPNIIYIFADDLGIGDPVSYTHLLPTGMKSFTASKASLTNGIILTANRRLSLIPT